MHVHIPEGAVPKDGPSAGDYHGDGHAVGGDRDRRSRSDVAMTGEITLRGRVLPIGGLKEKTAGGQRAPGSKRCSCRRKTERMWRIFPQEITKGPGRIVYVENMDEVIQAAFRAGEANG